MKISNILLWIAVVAVAGFTVYLARAPRTTLIDISNGERVELTCNIEKFESILSSIDPKGSISNGGNGTEVNIRFLDPAGKPAEVAGPPSPFKAVNPPIGPNGSMHVTQKVAYGALTDLKAVLGCLGDSKSTATEPQTPTPTPMP